MKHLTADEMIDFVSFNKMDSASLALASKVNAHIFACQDCRKKVEAFQTVYDEFVKMDRKGDFSRTVLNKETIDKIKEKNVDRLLDGYLNR